MAKEIRFRSISDLKGYDDRTAITEPSKTDPSQDEPLHKLVARLLRGEMVRSVAIHHEIGPETALEEAFNRQGIIDREGFDLADAAAIRASADGLIAKLSAKKAAKAPKEPAPPSSPPEQGGGQEPPPQEAR